MVPCRRFATYISRILLTVILVSVIAVSLHSLAKYSVKNDRQQRFVPAGSRLFQHDHDHHSHFAERRV